MAKMTIALRRDALTGKHNILVKLDSDADALPQEHEQLHKQVVQSLISQGLDLEDLGHVEIERVKPQVTKEEQDNSSAEVRDKVKIKR
jgi:hypothetical protein